MTPLPDAVRETLDTLPNNPGVYLFHGIAGDRQKGSEAELLYVGKATSLRQRVRSYFQEGTSDSRAFVFRLHREIVRLETFVTSTEKEAALLENQLIKTHQPRYNVKLRDDKEFLSLRLNSKVDWPRLEVVRRPQDDGARYFGPYHSASSARKTLRLVHRHFQLRTCTDAEFKRRTRPCLQYQIKRCPGPCVLEVDELMYRRQVEGASLFLGGDHDTLKRNLKSNMGQAAAAEEYELAAIYRDQLFAVERISGQQRVSAISGIDQDVLGLYREAERLELAVLQFRGGRLLSVESVALDDIAAPDDEVLAAFLRQWYELSPVPDEILLPLEVEASRGLEELLSEAQRTRESRRKVALLSPQRGPRKRLMELAQQNAKHAYEEQRRSEEGQGERLIAVQERLRLSAPPERIECIDISHSGGKHTVGAITALLGGAPDRKRYRTFRVRDVDGGDDYGAMYEVLRRRFRRAKEDEKRWSLPDLLVVDGGKGQLGMALAAKEDEGVELEIAALAKEKERDGKSFVERVYLPGQKNPIAVHSTPALRMLCLARDEAHRVANDYRKKLDKAGTLTSELDAVLGVGKKTRAKLLGALGSLSAIRDATEKDLISAGATKKQARAIVQYFSNAL